MLIRNSIILSFMLGNRFIPVRISPDPDSIMGTLSVRREYTLDGILAPGHNAHTFTHTHTHTRSNSVEPIHLSEFFFFWKVEKKRTYRKPIRTRCEHCFTTIVLLCCLLIRNRVNSAIFQSSMNGYVIRSSVSEISPHAERWS